ncbi:hypothetical protein B0H19DRAFT_1105044 [Mycena capillaripes]|nr:hypothetical protein B0H19DRAFT_1105044 [Mycena capillaripes]
MPPTPDQTQQDASSALPPFIECSDNSHVSTCTIAFIFLLLVFYALALWDRWLILKLRESQKLQAQPRLYGATQEHSPSLPSINANSTAPRTDGLNNKKLARNQKDDQKSSHLAPPPNVLNQGSMPCASRPPDQLLGVPQK